MQNQNGCYDVHLKFLPYPRFNVYYHSSTKLHKYEEDNQERGVNKNKSCRTRIIILINFLLAKMENFKYLFCKIKHPHP